MRQITITPDDLDALARIVAAEARSEGPLGQTAVLDVILNRAAAGRGWPSTIQGVITQPGQFEPLRGRSSWRELPEADPAIRDNLANALRARASGDRADTTSGATFFLNPTITNRRGTHFAASQNPTAVIGRHSFFNSTDRSPRPIPVPEHSLNLQLSAQASADSSAPTYERFGPFSVPNRPAQTSGRVDLNDPNIRPAMAPGATYGRSATANAEPFSGLVFHTAGDDRTSLNALLRYTQTPDAARGGTFGYHYLIDRDGTVHQTAPHSARTNHIKPPGSAERHASVRDLDLANTNALGIATFGSNPNHTQREAALRLAETLRGRYGIDASRVFGHGDLQRDRTSSEGRDLASTVRANATLSASVDPEIARSLGLDLPSRAPQAPQAPPAPPADTAIAARTPRPTQPRVAANASGEPLSQSELAGAYPDQLADPQVDATYGRFSSLVTNENLNALFPQLTQRESTGIGIGLASL